MVLLNESAKNGKRTTFVFSRYNRTILPFNFVLWCDSWPAVLLRNFLQRTGSERTGCRQMGMTDLILPSKLCRDLGGPSRRYWSENGKRTHRTFRGTNYYIYCWNIYCWTFVTRIIPLLLHFSSLPVVLLVVILWEWEANAPGFENANSTTNDERFRHFFLEQHIFIWSFNGR